MRFAKAAAVIAGVCALMLHMGQAQGEAFSIDYANPDKYLAAGPQTKLSPHSKEVIRDQIGKLSRTLDDLRTIFEWKQKNFKTAHARGAHLGTRTVNDSIQAMTLTGCNDHAALLAAVFRMYGFPTIVVNAAGIQWARDYMQQARSGRSGKKTRFKGHAFVEVYVGGRWILINSTSSEYVAQNYDPSNPVIPMMTPVESVGYYAYSKGLDQASTGVRSAKDTHRRMAQIAPTIARSAITMPPYTIERLVRKNKRR